jgi:ceramide glucosyltransferase
VVWLAGGMAAIAAAYQILALLAALSRCGWGRPGRAANTGGEVPLVSVLKPVRGADPDFYEAIRSNAAQDYPDFELLFGVSYPDDPAIPLIEQLIREFPNRSIRLLGGLPSTPNGKAGKLAQLAGEAKGSVLVISDGDIRVPEGYLWRVVAPLADAQVGLVTCAYRARAESWPARFEALGVATDFGPSTMVAPFVGIDEFGLGSTLVVRAADLARIGGFEVLADYLADDYQLGCRIHALGLRCVLSDVIVETHLSGDSWREVWKHQVRWARTIRVSRTGGYLGLPIANGTVWAVLAALAGLWPVAAGLIAIRYAMAFVAGWLVLRSSETLRLWWLIPVRDLWGIAVWGAGLFGDTVEWGSERLHLTPDGRIVP